ncbi:MAG: type II toxin-antitoxin system prevent-host-death family antitoxin [Frankiaceae bacterium]|jgi:prevent-host-death family protein
MDRNLSQRELRNDSGGVLRAVEAGETFIVTRNGVPAAELRPLRRRRAVPAAEALRGVRNLPPIHAGRFRADIDQSLDQSIDG